MSEPQTCVKPELNMNDPKIRARYKAALRKWDKRLRPLVESVRRAQRITADDLNIIVGPCEEPQRLRNTNQRGG